MLDIWVNKLGPRLRIKKNKPKIENFVFQLHYKATVAILIAFVVLVCARDQFGDKIRCISDVVPREMFESYCFFMATFTIVRHYNETLLRGGFLPHPGVGPMMDSDEKLHHTYYQWVPFVLFLQSICFYLPYFIWKIKEGGRIKALVKGLEHAHLSSQDEVATYNDITVPSKKNLEARLETITKYIILRLRITRTWSKWLVAMEVTNLLHVMLQIWLTNRFLNSHFYDLGPRVLSGDWNKIADPLETVFPKVTKCTFHKYGPSGTIQQHDALCVMALNIIHEKIYTVLWFWLLFLLIASVLSVIWRAISFCLYRWSLRFKVLMFRQITGNKFKSSNVSCVGNGCQYGDWLFLYYLAKNMHGLVFKQLFERLAKELEKCDKPYEQEGNEDNGTEHNLVGRVDYDDETLPLNDSKKSS